MQFYDKVAISAISGKWWDGCVSWRKEAGVPYGWPAGGNGGKWWSVVIQADENITTLIEYKYKKIFKAQNWEAGRSKQQYWANAEDLVLKVPVGTMIVDKKTQHVLHYFENHEEKYTVAKWGDGGLWNMEFKSSVLQYPNFATLWEPWHINEIILELQLMGDVALVGNPSVGKSTLINAVSNTKAKVADYPFTTLVPHLWSVKLYDFSYNIVDVPGLIPGASEWKWLGNQFLRHILKAKIYCLMGDLFAYDKWIDEMLGVLFEVVSYMSMKENRVRVVEKWDNLNLFIEERSEKIILVLKHNEEVLVEKMLVFVFNKQDLIQDDEIINELEYTLIKKLSELKIWDIDFWNIKKDIIKKNIFVVSSATHYWISDLTKFFADQLEHFQLKTFDQHLKKYHNIRYEKAEFMIKDITETEKPLMIEGWYLEEISSKYIKIRYLDDQNFCKIVFTTQRWNQQAEMNFWKKISDEWYLDLIQDAWFVKWDILKVKSYYEGQEDRFVQW